MRNRIKRAREMEARGGGKVKKDREMGIGECVRERINKRFTWIWRIPICRLRGVH